MAKGKVKKAAGKLAGKKVAFVGKFGYGTRDLETMKAIAGEEGGTVVDAEKSSPDYLVAGAGVGGNPPAAVAKTQKKHPAVQVLDEAGYFQLVNPTAEEISELMLASPQGHEFWGSMQDRLRKAGITLDLSGTDFRNQSITGTVYNVCLDGCDFRNAKFSAYLDKVKNAKFDGATMEGGSFTNAEDCSLKNITMNDTRWNPAEFVRCDFSGSRLAIRTGSYTTANGCVFKKADLSGADLGKSCFQTADFSGANLSGAQLEKSDFTSANLSGADLSRADLRNAIFVHADLRKAKFLEAVLSGADLTGALIDGADFTGATLTGVNLGGLDLSKAKNLQQVAARVPGPNMKELARVAKDSKRLQTSIELELGKDEYAVLQPSVWHYGTNVYPGAGYSHVTGNHTLGSSVSAPSFEQGMLNLVDLFSRGEPKFDTVKVEAKKSPLRGKELHTLAMAAWYEALGIQPPTAEEIQTERDRLASSTSGLREVMISELDGGTAGVKRWNERSDKERAKLGKLRKHDFSKKVLAGVHFGNRDLEGCNFDEANLKHAHFGGAQLKGASFAQADLRNANLAGSKPAGVSFEGAVLTDCNLRAANFLRCNFRNANLTKADFSFADLGPADFSGAKLDGVEFFRTKFDEKTVFPPDFVPPEGLIWKGAGPRPGTAPPPPAPKSGTLTFEQFVEQLDGKVEQARMEKAGSMLKAERFQLFAEVKDDSLAGIVKSQSSKDLVYSCRLASDGGFGCCTQNLRPCGGLRGALCKHLLVLIVGLAKAGQLDAATVDQWVNLSRSQKPAIEEDAMSATFLRYKGAEAGEVDWRPTETIPEDFYAM